MRLVKFYNKLTSWESAGVHIIFWGAIFSLMMLFSGYFEGGAFVSMLTLSLFSGALISRWPAVSQVEIFGSVIRLQRLSRDAEELIEELEGSRNATYRLFLHMIMSIGAGKEPVKKYNEYPFDRRDCISIDVKEGPLIERVLDEISEAGLEEELADDLHFAMALMVLVMATRMCEYEASNNMRISARDCDDSGAPEQVLSDYENFLNKYSHELEGPEIEAIECAIDRMRKFMYWEKVSKQYNYLE